MKPDETGGSRVRIDKWLWAARFFKTRSLAAQAVDLGRVELAGNAVKPSREVRAGDRLRIRSEGGEFEVEVLQVSGVRGPAAVAQTLYLESDESRQRRVRLAAERKALFQAEHLPETRPSKRDRRRIIQFRGRD